MVPSASRASERADKLAESLAHADRVKDEGSITSNFLTNERFLKIKFVAISSKKL